MMFRDLFVVMLIGFLCLLSVQCKKSEIDPQQMTRVQGMWNITKSDANGMILENSNLEFVVEGEKLTGFLDACPSCSTDPEIITDVRMENSVLSFSYLLKAGQSVNVSAALNDSNNRMDGTWTGATGGGDWTGIR